MTIWEKVLVNLENGARKTSMWAALFSERVKAEIAMARVRIRIDETKSLIDEQYRIIGRKVVELNKKEDSDAFNQLVHEEEIKAALEEIRSREKDLEDLCDQIATEQSAFTSPEKSTEYQV